MNPALLPFLTAAGESGTVLCLMLALLSYFCISGQRIAVYAAGSGFALAIMLTLLSKVFFLAVSLHHTGFFMKSPSGHTAMAGFAYGALAMALAKKRPGWVRAGLFIIVALFVLLVGLSRIQLGAHNAPEVMAGCLIAGSGLLPVWWLRPRGSVSVPAALAIGCVAILAGLVLPHFNIERLIRGFIIAIGA